MEEKVKKWIEDGKDPRSAHWQAGLEAVFNIFQSHLEPGILTSVAPLEGDAVSVFSEALEVVDLSPNIYGAFLPPSVADKLSPPESVSELKRISAGKPSFKILVVRPEQEVRIASCEVSPEAEKPGVDIFQSGVLLGNYDFEDRAEYLSNLGKIVRAHMWEKGRWAREDYKRYTVNWFQRVLDLQKSTARVEEDFSFFHTPTLIKSDRIDALFELIFEFFRKRLNDPDESLAERIASIKAIQDEDARAARIAQMAENTVLQLLTVVKDLELTDFDAFTEKEAGRFKHESERTIQRIARELAAAAA